MEPVADMIADDTAVAEELICQQQLEASLVGDCSHRGNMETIWN